MEPHPVADTPLTLPAPALAGLLAWLDGRSLLLVGATCRRLRAASLAPALWSEWRRPPCNAWRRRPPREALLGSLCAERHRRGTGCVREWQACVPDDVAPERVALDAGRLAVLDGPRVTLHDLERRRCTHEFRWHPDTDSVSAGGGAGAGDVAAGRGVDLCGDAVAVCHVGATRVEPHASQEERVYVAVWRAQEGRNAEPAALLATSEHAGATTSTAPLFSVAVPLPQDMDEPTDICVRDAPMPSSGSGV